MDISLEKLLELYGISQVKVSLLEEEVGRLGQKIEELTKEKDEQTLSDNPGSSRE